MIFCNKLLQPGGDSDDEDDEGRFPNVSIYPACGEHSTLSRKRTRLMEWETDPSLASKELQAWEEKLQRLKDEMGQMEQEELRWHHCFEQCRARLLSCVTSCKQQSDNYTVNTRNCVIFGESFATEEDKNETNIFSVWDNARSALCSTVNNYNDALGASSTNVEVTMSEADYAAFFAIDTTTEVRKGHETIESKDTDDEQITDASSTSAKSNNENQSPDVMEKLKSLYASVAKRASATTNHLVESDMQFFDENEMDHIFTNPANVDKPEDSNKKDGSAQLTAYARLHSLESWEEVLHELWVSPASAPRKKRKPNQAYPARAFPVSKTPYGIQLKLSPLSQFEDRYLAPYAMHQRMPGETLLGAENAALHCFGLLGRAAYLDRKAVNCSRYAEEWRIQMGNVKVSVEESRVLLNQVVSGGPAPLAAGANMLLEAAAVDDSVASLLMIGTAFPTDSSSLNSLLDGIDILQSHEGDDVTKPRPAGHPPVGSSSSGKRARPTKAAETVEAAKETNVNAPAAVRASSAKSRSSRR
jgi:hypothetical protein